MSDDINAGMNINPAGWEAGLDAAQKSAARFVAFLLKIEGTFQQVAAGSMNVAGAVAAIGGVSKAVEADLQALHAGEMTLAQMMSGIGGSAEQMNATVQSILTGNTTLEQSINSMGVKWDQNAKKIDVNIAALERMKKVQSELKASSWRNAIVDPSGKPISKTLSHEPFMSEDPMAYDSAAKIRIARVMQRMKKMATGAGIADFKLPSIEAGEGKMALNMARLQMAYGQLKDKIASVKTGEQDLARTREKNDRDFSRRLKAAVAAREREHAQIRRIQLAEEKLHRTRTFKSLDEMYQKGPSRSRLRELASQGVISPFNRQIVQSTNFVDRWAKKLEHGTSLGVKGVLGMVRGLQNANSQMALLTSSFTGLVAMISGVTAGAFFKMAMDFEHAMTRVNLLVKTGESDLKTLSDQAKELSRQFGSSPLATAEGMRIAISSDIPPGEVMQFMKEAEKLAVMSNASVEKTADLLAMLRNAFGLATSDMSRLRDMIFVMTDRGRVEVEQFASEIGKIAPTARLAGVNIQEMMAAFAALSRTRSTEQAGTLLRNLFKNIVDPSKEAKKAIQEFGLGLTPAALRANGLIKTVANFREELKKHPGILNTVADDLRELAAWGDLTDSQFAALTSTFDEMSASVGLADQKTKEMMDTTQVKWERMMAQMKISAIDMGGSLLNVFSNITGGGTGIELMQKKIESGFKRMEMAVRIFAGVFQFLWHVASGVLAGILAAIRTVFNAVHNVWNALRMAGQTVQISVLEGKIKNLEEQRTDAVKRGSLERVAAIDDEIDVLNQMAEATQKGFALTAEDAKTNVDDIIAGWQGAGKFIKGNAEMIGANLDAVAKLAKEVADLNLVIENMETDAAAAAKAEKAWGNGAAVAAKKIEEAKRDQAQLIKEWYSETLKGEVMEGYDRLKEWIKDNRDAIKGAIMANREWAKEQKRAAQDAFKELQKLQEQRDKWNDSINESIEKLKDKDRKPLEIVKQRKEHAKGLEEKANVALKQGDVDRSQDLIEQAIDVYKSLLDVEGGDNKTNRLEVIKNLERLRDEMDKVYGFQTEDLEKTMTTSEAAAQQFEKNAKMAEAQLKLFEQGVIDVGRAIKDLGTAPSDEELMKIKDMILKLTGDTKLFEAITADPALQAIDKVIEKAKELKDVMGSVPDELIMKLQGAQLIELLRGTTGFVPMEPNRSTTNNQNNVTNVDSIHVNVAGDEGGPKKADARRLARDIKRHITRGESPALGGSK